MPSLLKVIIFKVLKASTAKLEKEAYSVYIKYRRTIYEETHGCIACCEIKKKLKTRQKLTNMNFIIRINYYIF